MLCTALLATWTRHDLYKKDGQYHNIKGFRQLTENLFQYIALNSD